MTPKITIHLPVLNPGHPQGVQIPQTVQKPKNNTKQGPVAASPEGPTVASKVRELLAATGQISLVAART